MVYKGGHPLPHMAVQAEPTPSTTPSTMRNLETAGLMLPRRTLAGEGPDPAPIPEPGPLVLLGTVLLGAGYRRLKRPAAARQKT